MEILKNLRQAIKALFFRLVYFFALLVPKNNTVWVFYGWIRNSERGIFADNAKYLFLYTSQHVPTIQPIWIGTDTHICTLLNNAGYQAHSMYSVKGMYYTIRAKFTFVSSLMTLENWALSGGSNVVQLWHGKSVKKTGYNSPYGLRRYRKFLYPHLFKTFYKFVAISEYLATYTKSDFQVPEPTILVSGIPKYDVLNKPVPDSDIDLDKHLEQLLNEIQSYKPNRTILYGPTFRPDGSNPLKEIDFLTLNQQLSKQNDHMVISLHPKFNTTEWVPDTNLSNIHFSQGEGDSYPLLHKFDLLVTDYSSLAIDFLFMKKPVIIFAYDFDEYQAGMGIHEHIWSLMPEPKVFTFQDLLTALDSDLAIYQNDITNAWQKLFTFDDAQASQRIVDELLNTPVEKN